MHTQQSLLYCLSFLIYYHRLSAKAAVAGIKTGITDVIGRADRVECVAVIDVCYLESLEGVVIAGDDGGVLMCDPLETVCSGARSCVPSALSERDCL